jgi:hypothetical protein
MIAFKDWSPWVNEFIQMYNSYQRYCGEKDLIHIHPNGIPVSRFVYGHKAIQDCDDRVVAIDIFYEGLNIQEFFDQLPKDKKYVLFSNASWSPDIDLGFEYLNINYNMVLFHASSMYYLQSRGDFFIDRTYHYEKEKTNLFCSLVGMKKRPRDKFVNAAMQRLNYNNYILNYHGVELGQPSRHLDVDFDYGGYASRPLFLHDATTDHKAFWSIPFKLYNSSRFNLVVETSQCNNDFHLTEKTIKPLYVGQPFVVFADRHHLKNLRSLGFRTFGNLWPEDYDEIADLDMRIDAIIKLLNDLKNFNWGAHRYELEAITNHNRLAFLNIAKTQIPVQMQRISEALKNCPWIPKR